MLLAFGGKSFMTEGRIQEVSDSNGKIEKKYPNRS